MSALTSVSVATLLSDLRRTPKDPSVKLEKSEAPKIQTRTGVSSGKKQSRLCFNELDEECFRVAARVKGCCAPCGDYSIAQINHYGESKDIWLNVKSAMHRFDLPRDVVVSNLSNLNRIVRLVAQKRLFQNLRSEELFANEADEGVSLVPIRNPFPSLIPLEKIAQMAQEQNRCFRLSKRCYHLAKSIDVYPGGFIAVDTGKFLGEGTYARAKVSSTLQGVEIARRIYTFDLGDPDDQAIVLRTMNIFNEFRGKTGVLDTLSMGVYENKEGKCKFVSFHPLYEQNFSESFKHQPTEKDRLKMAHELLQGLSTIAALGNHRDITDPNIFLRTTGAFEAVIADLEFFRYHNEKEDGMWNDFPGPESYGTQREVWDLGKALYYLLQSELEPPPWDFSSKQYLITEQDLDYGMKFSQFPPELERLLRGMLAINRDERWTAKESLECFERYLSSRQDQNSGVSQ